MPPRYTYWTIIVGSQATAFRAATQDELLPTLKQLQSKQPDAVMMWFARGKLWPSEEASAMALRMERQGSPGRERRGPAWRPGGQHEDPRDRFKVPRDVKRQRFAARVRRDRTEEQAPRGEGQGGRPTGPREEKPRTDRPVRPAGQRTSGDRPFRPAGQRTGGNRPFGPAGQRTSGDRPFPPGEKRPAGSPPSHPKGGPGGDRPFRPKYAPRADRPFRPNERQRTDRPLRPTGPRGSGKPAGGNFRGGPAGGRGKPGGGNVRGGGGKKGGGGGGSRGPR